MFYNSELLEMEFFNFIHSRYYNLTIMWIVESIIALLLAKVKINKCEKCQTWDKSF
jgi:hypothetical protein